MSRLLKLALAVILVFSAICSEVFARKAFQNDIELDSEAATTQNSVHAAQDVRLRTLLDAESVDPSVYGYPGVRERGAPAHRRNRRRHARAQPKRSWYRWWDN